MLKSRVVEKKVKDKFGKIFTYVAIVVDYKDNSGRWKQCYHNTHITLTDYHRNKKKEVEQIRDWFVNKISKELENKLGKIIDYDNLTVMQMLCEYVDGIKSNISESVYIKYTKEYPERMREFLRKKGNENTPLEKFTENDAKSFINFVRTRKNKYGQFLSDNTIKHYLSFFKPAFRNAFKDKIVSIDAFARIKCPKIKIKKPEFFSKKDAETIWNELDLESVAIPLKLAFLTGVRRSELLGLKWSAIDFIRGQIEIEEKVIYIPKKGLKFDLELKTASSHRTIPLTAEANALLKLQESITEKNKESLLYNHKYDNYVFVDEIGEIVKPDRLTNTIRRICNKNKIKGHMHELRHTYGSHLRKSGVDLKVIQELLGHSTYSTTANYYLGVDNDDKRTAVDKFSEHMKFK